MKICQLTDDVYIYINQAIDIQISDPEAQSEGSIQPTGGLDRFLEITQSNNHVYVLDLNAKEVTSHDAFILILSTTAGAKIDLRKYIHRLIV